MYCIICRTMFDLPIIGVEEAEASGSALSIDICDLVSLPVTGSVTFLNQILCSEEPIFN